MKKEKAVIDGCNVVYVDSPRRKPSIKNIFAVISAIEASGREPVVIVHPAVLSILGEFELLERLLSQSCVVRIPAGSDPARAVLEKAQECDAIIVSNNAYVDYWNEFPWVELCRLPVAAVDGRVSLLEARFKNTDLASLARTAKACHSNM